jgi:hypothetical protein
MGLPGKATFNPKVAGSIPAQPTPSHSQKCGRLRHHEAASRELPAGKVTFLFTDVEGSTKLLRELGAD